MDVGRPEAWSERVGSLGERSVLRVISEGGGAGSGFLIHPSGLAVTNAHVVGASAGGFAESVSGSSGFEVLAAGPSRDLALLRLDGPGPFTPLRLGESRALKLGAPVLAVGAPQGMFPVVSVGVFGGRSIPGMIADVLVPEQLIHGAPTLRGSSGCALLSSEGLVVGIQSAKPGQELVMAAEPADEDGRLFDENLRRWVFQTEGFGLAVPVEDLLHLMPAWIAPEWETGLETGFSCEMRGGRVYVSKVSVGTPAELAGLEVGDMIMSCRGREVWSLVDLALWLSDPAELSLVVERYGSVRSLSFKRASWERPARKDLSPGCRWVGARGSFFRVPELGLSAVTEGGEVAAVQLPSEVEGADEFALELKAWVDVPVAGRWVFELSSDDGSQLFIRDRLVVDGDGLHAHKAASGVIQLEAGLQPLRVTFFEAGGHESLSARWGLEGEALVDIPLERLGHHGPTGW